MIDRGRRITTALTKFVVFTAVSVTATAVVALTIANPRLRPSTIYSAQFLDVTGLNDGDEVRIAGVKVGEVKSINLADHNVANVTFTVSDRQLPESVTATIKYRNLVGQRYIALEQGAGDANQFMPAGATIPLQRTKPALDLTVLLGGFKPLLRALSPNDVNQLSYEIIQVLQGEGGTVDSLLAHTVSLTTSIAQRDQIIGQVINNLKNVMGTVAARDQQLSALIVQLQQMVSGMAGDRAQIGDAITAMDGLTNTTAGLLQQARPGLRQDIDSLGMVAAVLNSSDIPERSLRTAPAKLEAGTRLAVHGSWMDGFLCTVSGHVEVSDVQLDIPLTSSASPRCAP